MRLQDIKLADQLASRLVRLKHLRELFTTEVDPTATVTVRFSTKDEKRVREIDIFKLSEQGVLLDELSDKLRLAVSDLIGESIERVSDELLGLGVKLEP